MKANFVYKGDALDYYNTGTDAIAAGDIIALATRIGVAGTDIAPGEKGSVNVTGVFALPKTATGAVAQGTAVYWDGSGITTTASGNTAAGYAAEASAAGAGTIEVKLLG
ncbi:MAG: DUF2190 family protein [Lachnospiraceae bacterium]|nr:DUF2190 family protein [Lachnospiraceae bacterium]